jgi:aldose 1-epimerase
MPINSAPHANHGRAFLQEWQVRDDLAAANELVIETALVDPWPFGGMVRQTFTLTHVELVVGVEVVAGDQPMPAMAGWHPWFRRQLDRGGPAELSFAAASIYEVDDDLIPTGAITDVPPPPWNACFVGVTSGPQITWPDAVSLHISSTFDHWVIFTEPEHALCVEPQSGPPAEFDLDPHVLQPGERLSGSMTLRWG